MQRRIWAAVLVASLGWGTSGVATRVALDEAVEPYAIAAIRAGLAAVGVLAFLAWRRSLTLDGVTTRVGLVMGATNLAIPLITSNVALQYASAGFIGLTAALIPLFTAVTAHVMLPDERMHRVRTLGLIVSLAGVAVLVFSGDSGLVDGGRPVLAAGLSLVGVISIAVGSVYAKRYAGQYAPLSVAGVQFVTGTAVAVVAMLIVEGVPDAPSALGTGSLVYMALATTVMPFLVYYWLIRHVTVTYSSIIGYIVPLVAVIVGVIALDERLQPGILVGGALILAGVVITDRLESHLRVRGPAVRS